MKNYGNFLELYSYQILQIGGVNQRDFAKLLMDFNKYCQEYKIPSQVQKQFGDLSRLKEALNNAFRYYKYYFPDKAIPEIYTYYSNFSESVITDDGLIGIGLDKYLGVITSYSIHYTKLYDCHCPCPHTINGGHFRKHSANFVIIEAQSGV